MSLNRFAVALLNPGVIDDALVVSEPVWQAAQPIALNTARPVLMEAAPPGTVVDGVGGASMRMNNENFTTSLDVPRLSALKCVRSSGVGLNLQFAGNPATRPSPGSGRSCPKASLVTPISTL